MIRCWVPSFAKSVPLESPWGEPGLWKLRASTKAIFVKLCEVPWPLWKMDGFFRRRRRNYLGVRGRAVGSRLWCCDKSSLASKVLRWISAIFGLMLDDETILYMLSFFFQSATELHLASFVSKIGWVSSLPGRLLLASPGIREGHEWFLKTSRNMGRYSALLPELLFCKTRSDLSVTYSQHWVSLAALTMHPFKVSAKHLLLLSFPRLSQDASALRRTARSFRTRKVPIWIFRVTLQNSFVFSNQDKNKYTY